MANGAFLLKTNTTFLNQFDKDGNFIEKKIYKRCLTNSYKKIPQATETFKDSILPYIGSLALKSTSLSIEGVIPFPSAPIIIAHESLKSTS